jgi:hypothetical protein
VVRVSAQGPVETHYGVLGGSVIWEFQGSPEDWVRFQLALMQAEDDSVDAG